MKILQTELKMLTLSLLRDTHRAKLDPAIVAAVACNAPVSTTKPTPHQPVPNPKPPTKH